MYIDRGVTWRGEILLRASKMDSCGELFSCMAHKRHFSAISNITLTMSWIYYWQPWHRFYIRKIKQIWETGLLLTETRTHRKWKDLLDIYKLWEDYHHGWQIDGISLRSFVNALISSCCVGTNAAIGDIFSYLVFV